MKLAIIIISIIVVILSITTNYNTWFVLRMKIKKRQFDVYLIIACILTTAAYGLTLVCLVEGISVLQTHTHLLLKINIKTLLFLSILSFLLWFIGSILGATKAIKYLEKNKLKES